MCNEINNFITVYTIEKHIFITISDKVLMNFNQEISKGEEKREF